jgi:hypothetical protein
LISAAAAARGAPAAMSTIATLNKVILISSSIAWGILQQVRPAHHRRLP